jgi:hypothetical protein
MGFIEKLEQKKIWKESLEQARLKKLQEQTSKTQRPFSEELEIQRQQGLRYQELTASQKQESERYYIESGCEQLVLKLRNAIEGGQVYESDAKSCALTSSDYKFNLRRKFRNEESNSSYAEFVENGMGNHVVLLEWGIDPNRLPIGTIRPWKDYDLKCIAIETCPSGDIYFYGGLLGSSTRRKEQWQGNKGCLEGALKNAYCHPKQKRVYEPYRDPPGGTGENG